MFIADPSVHADGTSVRKMLGPTFQKGRFELSLNQFHTLIVMYLRAMAQ